MYWAACFIFGAAILAAAKAQSFDTIFADMQAHQLRFDPIAIAYARMDPIMAPGVNNPSGHLHTIVGPNVFSSASTSDQLRTGDCTSFNIGSSNPDMSAYWSPSLYYVHANGSFTLLPMVTSSIYYNMYTNVTMQPFPQDFQMMTGNATWLDGGCANGHGLGDGYFYTGSEDPYTLPRNYTQTLGVHITFPDCWDGQSFTMETQNEHMQYSAYDIGFPCPNPNWIKLPQIVLSFGYETPGTEDEYPTNPNGPTYVLATGDQYGCSLHADFMMGWQPDKLQQVIDECSNLGFDNADQCSVFSMNEASDELAFECKYSELIPDEAIGLVAPVEQLPGCLLIDGELASGCDSTVSFVEPDTFDTKYRIAGWPIVTDGNSGIYTTTKASTTTTTKAATTTTTKAATTTTTATEAPAPTSTQSTLYMCSGENWTEDCVNDDWVDGACYTLYGTPLQDNIQSFGPASGYCRIYEGPYCTSELTSTPIAYPGTGDLSSLNPGSFMCTMSDIAPTLGGTYYTCTGDDWSGTCENYSFQSGECVDLAGTAFQANLHSFGPSAGRCFLYSDNFCNAPVEKDVTSPGISSITASIQSVLCI